ncbi:MAG: sigma-70 family RNA polymerase sigma factor [Chthoniobacterales bacterium]|nr:sigma-70 family RNA polymerase sigma factor [Chthoniobacterales bacterium]
MISCLPFALSEERTGVVSPYEAEREHRDAAGYLAGAESRPLGDRSRLEEIEVLGRSCREGDALAWDALFSTAWPVLVTFVHRLYRSFAEQDAEDIAQVSLEAAIKGIRTFSGKGSFRGWLFGIAAKQAATFHRTRSARKRGAGLLVSLHDAIDPSDDAKSPADVSAASDRAGILHRALGELDEENRDLVHLHFFGELTFKEIAAVRRMNAKTVCTRLTRCKERLLVILARSNLTNADG